MTCTGIINDLNILKYLINDEYRVVYTLESKNIFYISSSDVFNTNCATVTQFSIIEDFKNCTKHLRVKYKQDNKDYYGFYTKEGIIREDSPTFDGELCNQDEVFLNFDNKYNLVRRGMKIILLEKEEIKESFQLNIDGYLGGKAQFNLSFLESVNYNYQKINNGILELSRDFLMFTIGFINLILSIKFFIKTDKDRLFRLVNSLTEKFYEKKNNLLEARLKEIEINLENIKIFTKKEKEYIQPTAPTFEKSVAIGQVLESSNIIYPKIKEYQTLENISPNKTNSTNILTRSKFKSISPICETKCKYCKKILSTKSSLKAHIKNMRNSKNIKLKKLHTDF